MDKHINLILLFLLVLLNIVLVYIIIEIKKNNRDIENYQFAALSLEQKIKSVVNMITTAYEGYIFILEKNILFRKYRFCKCKMA